MQSMLIPFLLKFKVSIGYKSSQQTGQVFLIISDHFDAMYFSSLILATFFATSSSFTHPILNQGQYSLRQSLSRKNSSGSDQGWNNDNFLDALGGGSEALDSANSQYYSESENRAAFREQRMQSMSGFGGDNGIGAQVPVQSPPSVPPPIANKNSQSPQAHQMEIYQQQLQVWQQQMNAFSQFSAANPEAAAQMTIPPPPTPPTFTGSDAGIPENPPVTPVPAYSTQQTVTPQNVENLNPKEFLPQGSGNKDAYEISNPADVYLAQLKRDSAVRTEARKKGDIVTANKPFEDVGVKAIGSILSDELIESRRKQIAQNGGEFETSRDEMIIPYAEEEDTTDSNYTGISYREKLNEVKKQRQGIAGENVEAITSSVTSPTQPVPVEVPSVPEERPNFALPVTDEKEMTAIPAPSMEDTEETRRSIRSLMGLILKQRGGPGFGAGRLKEAEAKRLESSSKEIIALLKSEAGMEAPLEFAGPESVNAEGHKGIPSVSLPDRGGREASGLTGAIACVDAAVSMYLNAEPNSQKDLLVPVRNALNSALETMNEAIARESTNTVKEEPQKPVYATTMEFPDEYQVTKADVVESKVSEEVVTKADVVESKVSEEVVTNVDSNTSSLKGVYEGLKSFAGDQKYGLRDVKAEEVTHIKDLLADMRSVLMDELENGITN